jgi:multidrug efflux pump subunit AcrA (membrane-fusion protein)
MTATASVVSDSRQGVVLAPNRAIKTQGQNKTVQVQTAAGTTETRAVKVGLSNDQMTEITSGVQAGDKVVIAGTTTAAVSPTGAVPGVGALAGTGGPPAR